MTDNDAMLAAFELTRQEIVNAIDSLEFKKSLAADEPPAGVDAAIGMFRVQLEIVGRNIDEIATLIARESGLE